MAAWEQAGVGLTRAWRQRRLRRGLLGLAAATLGAAALQQREGGTAFAAPISGDSSSAVTAGVTGTNSAINGTGVSGNASGDGGTAVSGVSTSTSGMTRGVVGLSSSPIGIGVDGANHATSGTAIGVLGRSLDSPTAVGVLGRADGVAVKGSSANGVGVEGDSTNSVGVIGRATAAGNPNPGIIGSATNGYGVFGFSANSNGIAGQSGTSAAGCVGFAGAPGGYGIYGGIAVQGGYAGGFAGPVLVVGDFTATGGAKSAAVPHPDGTHRRLYCMESPESLFEDFGEGRLANGRAEVRLDPDFGAVVHNDSYHVFLTEYGDSGGLYVGSRSPAGFEVRARGPAANGTFSYRVVARRKDIPGPRLEKIKLPEPLKELVRPPEPPARSGR